MNRIELSQQKIKELGISVEYPEYTADPDFFDILNRFIYGEVYYKGTLDNKQRELITLVVLATSQTLKQLREHIGSALDIGLTPVEIKEAIYHCTPYIGFQMALNALEQVNDVFKEKNISLPLASQKQIEEDERLEKGLEMQLSLSGKDKGLKILERFKSAPENYKHIYEYLATWCFGDYYTRSGLDLKTRELLTFCILITLGGCENQVKAHVINNTTVGNSKELLVTAITHCMPFIGCPRTLNALDVVNAIIP